MASVFVSWLFGGAGVAVILFILLIFVLSQKSSLIFGIYPSKGLLYHIKYPIALFVIQYLRRKLFAETKLQHSNTEYINKIDKPQELSKHPQSYDVVSFMAANNIGEKLLITLERRKRGILKAALYLWLPEKGLLCLPKLPDMVHFTTDGDVENSEFRGAGFHIYPVKCMQQWCVEYVGELRQQTGQTLLPVKLNLKFNSNLSYFNYNKDLSGSVIADSVAREAWNDSFYTMLQNVDQMLEKRMHYEQNGLLTGDINIGMEKLSINMKGFRDHSFGTERCLSTINRYVYFAIFLDDGTNMVIGNLSQPSFFLSSLKVGYVCTSKGVYQPITECNFELYSYGEKGTPAKHKNFIVKTAEKKYFVQIREEDCAVRYIGGNWESKVFNQFVACTVNGIQGHGITEYLYRHSGGRSNSVGAADPEWYQRACVSERSLKNRGSFDENIFF